MNFRKREDTGHCKRQHYIALGGDIVLERAMDRLRQTTELTDE